MGTHLNFDPARGLIKLVGSKPRVAIAFSGGIDSTFLAHALIRQRRKFANLRLLHIDHHLQPASASWARHCARMAKAWRIPLTTLHARIARNTGDSPEAAAREARYALLSQAMEQGEVLVTAQHRDDQAETLLLQLFRGAGVAGLSAMPAIAVFGPGHIARPLLSVARSDIEALARKARLNWIEDPSNADTRFSRNFLRHRLMPQIREHWPGVDRALVRTASHMAEAQTLLATVAIADLAGAADAPGLSVSALRALPMARRRNAIRQFIATAGVELPEASRLTEMSGPLLQAREDAQPEVRWSNVRMRRRAGRLELEVVPEVAAQSPRESLLISWNWSRQRRLLLDDGTTLELLDDAEGPLDLDRLPKILCLRSRRGGESLRPGPRARTQTLKALMSAAKIPVEQRAQMPLLFTGENRKDRLIAAGERWIDASVAANGTSRRRARLRWRPSH
jgi:tRNA(Ile)-lysidine synthase